MVVLCVLVDCTAANGMVHLSKWNVFTTLSNFKLSIQSCIHVNVYLLHQKPTIGHLA